MASDKKFPKIKQSGVIQIRGRDVTTYEGKLDFAHQNGMKSLQVKILKFPTELNGQMCFCHAELVTADDRVFSDIADASWSSPHLDRTPPPAEKVVLELCLDRVLTSSPRSRW